MKKLKTGTYQDTHKNVSFLLAKVSKPYTNDKGLKSYHVGWGFVVDGESNGGLEPAFGSRKKARIAAVKHIDRMTANTSETGVI